MRNEEWMKDTLAAALTLLIEHGIADREKLHKHMEAGSGELFTYLNELYKQTEEANHD